MGADSGSSSLRSPEPVPVSAHSGDDPAREFERVLSDLVFFVEWHMPYKGDHHPTYAAPVQAAHRLLKQARTARHAIAIETATAAETVKHGSVEDESAGRSEAEVSPIDDLNTTFRMMDEEEGRHDQ